MPPEELDEQALVEKIKAAKSDIAEMKSELEDRKEKAGYWTDGEVTTFELIASKSDKERQREIDETSDRISAESARLRELEDRLNKLRGQHDADDTGHYDDGHSFDWTPKPAASWTKLSESINQDADVERIERGLADDFDDRPTASGRPAWLPVAVAAVAVVVAGGLVLALRGGDDDKQAAGAPTVADSAVDSATTLAAGLLPAVCDVLDAATVGQIVGGRPMTSAPDATGKGCLYTATDEPNIDLSTAYPPYIAQVSLTYNAPQPGLTEDDIANLFETSRAPTDVDVPWPGGGLAYSSGGGSAVALDRGVMIICGTSGTVRPESIPDVQAMCLAIATALRAQLP